MNAYISGFRLTLGLFGNVRSPLEKVSDSRSYLGGCSDTVHPFKRAVSVVSVVPYASFRIACVFNFRTGHVV